MSDATPEKNDWVRPVSLGVTVTLIAWCFIGWILDKGWTIEGGMLAVLTGVFQALGFNASAQMRRASAKQRRRAATFWTYTLCVTAGWTAFAAHHAYTVIAGDPPPFAWTMEAIGAFLQSSAALVLLAAAATIDPLLGWAIEETEKAPAPVVTPPQNSEVTSLATERAARRPRRLGVGATAALIGVAALSPTVATGAPPSQPVTQTRNSDASREVSQDDIRRACREIDARGLRPSYRNVATHLGVPVSRVERGWTRGVPLAG